MSWNCLPPELRFMIWEHLLVRKPGSRPRTKYDAPSTYFHTNYATVSWEWHAYFGKRNFSSVVLSQADIPEFKRIFDEMRISNRDRRLSLRRLWLHVKLPPYSCESCNVEETAEEANTNSKIYTTALWDFFTCLKEWDNDDKQSGRQLRIAMVLSVSSPSDTEHHFRYVQAQNITFPSAKGLVKGVSDLAEIHDEAHGWYGGVQVVPSLGARLRHVGKPLVFDLAYVKALLPPLSLPELDFVHSLWIPRQFHREIPRLGLIFHSLPMLAAVNYESWCRVQDSDEWSRTQDLRQIVKYIPHNLEKLSVSEDHAEVLNSSQRWLSDTVVTGSLRIASLNLVELDASGRVDAHWFFWPFSAKYRAGYLGPAGPRYDVWEKLEALTLTSGYLTWDKVLPRNSRKIENLLESAATAALFMPKLRIMQLWGARRHEACFFRYTVSQACRTRHPSFGNIEGPLIEWMDTRSSATRFGPGVVQESWQKVSCKYGHGRLHSLGGNIDHQDIESRNSILKYLHLSNKDKTYNQYFAQQMWEADNLKFAWKPPPQS